MTPTIPDVLVASYKKKLFHYYLKVYFQGMLPYWLFKKLKHPEEPVPPFPIEESNPQILHENLTLNYSAKMARRWLETVNYAKKFKAEEERERTL